jgi:hypothetical protein
MFAPSSRNLMSRQIKFPAMNLLLQSDIRRMPPSQGQVDRYCRFSQPDCIAPGRVRAVMNGCRGVISAVPPDPNRRSAIAHGIGARMGASDPRGLLPSNDRQR